MTSQINRDEFESIGRVAAWSSGTFALGGLTILIFAVAFLPYPSPAVVYAARHGLLLMFPGALWSALQFVFTDRGGTASFGNRAVATSLMFVGAAALFTVYCLFDWYLASQETGPGKFLWEWAFVVVVCLMPALCLTSGLTTAAAYEFLTEPEPSIPNSKSPAPATTTPVWGYFRRRYRGQGMDEVYLD